MHKKRNIINAISIFIILISSFVFLYTMNLYNNSPKKTNAKNKNKDFKEELFTIKSNYEKLLENEKEITKKYKEIKDLESGFLKVKNSPLNEYNLDYLSNNKIEKLVPIYRAKLIRNTTQVNNFKETSNYFFDNSTRAHDNTNIFINDIVNSYYIQKNLNSHIIDDDFEVFSFVGAVKYYKNRSNYYLKSLISRNIENEFKDVNIKTEEFSKAFIDTINFKTNIVNFYEEILPLTSDNLTRIENLRNSIINESNFINISININNEDKYDYKKLNLLRVFNFDTINSTINYIGESSILEKSIKDNNINLARSLVKDNKTLVTEEIKNDGNREVSYFDINGTLVFKFNVDNNEILYIRKSINE